MVLITVIILIDKALKASRQKAHKKMSYQYITAHCGKLLNIKSESELNYEKLRCPECKQIINNSNQ